MLVVTSDALDLMYCGSDPVDAVVTVVMDVIAAVDAAGAADAAGDVDWS